MLKEMPLNNNLILERNSVMPVNIGVISLLLCFTFLNFLFWGQSINIAYRWNAKFQKGEIPKYFYQSHKVENPALIKQEVQKAKIHLAAMGYFTASVFDTIMEDKKYFWIDFGKKYHGISLKVNSDLSPWAPKSGNDGIIDLSTYSAFLTKTLMDFHANGYPFAEFRFTQFSEKEHTLFVDVSIDKGRKMLWKELKIKGDSSLSVSSLQAELRFKIGDNFTVDKQKEIYDRLKQLSYIQIIKPPEYQFSTDGVTLFLYVKSNKISSFNGAVGLQPNPVSQKMGLTGDIQLKLVNSLKRAEQLDFVWRSVKPATQLLTFRFSYPYLFNTSFGSELKFNLYKRDSTFLELKTGLAIQYTLSNNLIIKGMYSLTASNKLYASGSSQDFPNSASFRNTMFGLGISFRNLDYLPNPTKGFQCSSEAFFGQRKNQPDTIGAVPTNRLSFAWEQFISLSKRFVVRYSISLDSYNAQNVYSNECYRFGGLANQRGFNEENFLATTKSINQLELRYLLDKNSSVFLFYDQSLYENRSNASYRRDNPYGFGIGTNLGSKAGIFSLAYALGVEKNNPIDFKTGKIHFGYIAYF